uniref:Uncharacterized protein n=1 Tax=Esox lucius TaxID=8010 RepID=A0AAY5KZ30_ESOLU
MTKCDDPTIRSVILRNRLTDKEKCNFTKKQEDICKRFEHQHTQFHGFNIMCENYSKEYITETCEMLRNGKKKVNEKRQNAQLLAILSLLNSYVPGSYLLESQCNEFLKQSRMNPFDDLIVTFTGQEDEHKRVRMKHPMIAHQCVMFLAEAGLTRSATAMNFLNNFCKGEVQKYLVPFIKEMFTKRDKTLVKSAREEELGEVKVKLDNFSKLILDIKEYERDGKCVEVLRNAVDMFRENPFFSQTLARFYYIEMENYTEAEDWAVKAKSIDTSNSFIADTLGQIHKSNLRKNITEKQCSAGDILEIAGKAITAFKEEEMAAEKEVEQRSYNFNDRGRFGYLQVAKYLFEALKFRDSRWKEILTGKNQSHSQGHGFPGTKLNKYLPYIEQLREGVKKRYEFFEKYLTYTKDKIGNPEPVYFHTDIFDCYKKYTEMMPTSFPGLLSCVDRDHLDPDLQLMQQHWKKIISAEKISNADATQNYILVNIILSQEGVRRQGKTIPLQTLQQMLNKNGWKKLIYQNTEFNLLALMLFWPENNKMSNFPYEQTVKHIRASFERDYGKYFRNRYIVPLFLLGKGEGLSRLIHKTRVDILIMKELCMGHLSQEEKSRKLSEQWSSGALWGLQGIQDRLLKCKGVVEHYELFLHGETDRIKVFPDRIANIRNAGPVTFYLGFNFGGPVAFNIMYVKA